MGIWNNDEAIAFFNDHGYPRQYNDGLLRWLRDVYDLPYEMSSGGSTLPDLLKRYQDEFGDDFNMRVLSKSGAEVKLIEPAATFTSATPSSAASGADTLLTSAGVHGLTSAVAVGASIYISAGTGWTVGFHTITAIAVDTTGVTIQIDTPYSASMDTPTIALANTEVTLATISVPALQANSRIEIDSSWMFTASTNSKTLRIRWSSYSFSGNINTAGTTWSRSHVAFQNKNSTSAQQLAYPVTASWGSNNTTPNLGAIDTSVATSLTLTAQPATANEVMALAMYNIILFV